MTLQTPVTAADQDKAAYGARVAGDMPALLTLAAKKSGRSLLQISREFSAMSRSRSRVSIGEYVRWGLFDKDRHTEDARRAFVSDSRHWEIAHKCCNQSWNAAAEDKVLAGVILGNGGVPVPEAVAVIDRSARHYPGIRKINAPDELRALIMETGPSVFGKIVDGMVSFGAFSVTAADQTHITCHGHDPMTWGDFLTDFIGDNAYLVQKRLDNHSGFARYCSALATVRMVNLVTSTGVETPFAVIKLPQGDNIADAFWRGGNLACAVDVGTGRITTVVQRGDHLLEFLEDHHSVPGLMGLVLPHWDKLREINERAVSIYAPIRYQSADIAITQDGPVVVELNYGGSFDLPQNATGQGLLTPEFLSFLAECGVDLDAPPGKKSAFGFLNRR